MTTPASHRLRALAALSGSLTDSLTPEDAADLVEKKALSAMDATSAVVLTLGSFPPGIRSAVGEADETAAGTLNVVHAIGLSAEQRAAIERLPLDARVPLAEVARMGSPLFLHSESELLGYPEWGPLVIRDGVRAAAIVPVWANGQLRGVLGLSWGRPQTFHEDDRAFILTLGVMCAQAIMRAHLKAAELVAREDAEEANATKTLFLTTMSHELRTPLNAVLGYTDLLAAEIGGPINALQKNHLGRVMASGKHLLELIEELLGYARLESGVEIVRPTAGLLDEVVEQSLVLVRPLAEQKGLRIRVEGGPLDPVLLHTDTRKVRQILVNLIANAVKFAETGEVVLGVRVLGTGTDLMVHFAVTDTGLGIAVENQERVFDAFWREDSTLTRMTSGTGLGLSVSRRFARLLGGDVRVAKSSLGAGSTFIAWVPVRYSNGTPLDAEKGPRLLREVEHISR